MLYDSYFKNPKDVPLLLDKIRIYSAVRSVLHLPA